VEREGVTVLPVAPPVLSRWRAGYDMARLRDRLATARLAVSGSAPVAPELVRDFADGTGVPVHQGYGLTEASPVVTSTLHSVAAAGKPGSVGAAVPGVEIRLVDDAGGTPAGDDPGEIWLRGENLFSGYWPDGADGPAGDGWFATGDVGLLDADGDLFLVDRLKELVIVSGFNVYPSEVEDVIDEVDGVAESAVIGAADPGTGEAVVAYVRPVEGSSYTAAEVEDMVREHCETRLARFKRPREVHVVDELPHTATGKVAKGRLRAARRRSGPGLLE
jgi:long-chain acyl-CoA synthetase